MAKKKYPGSNMLARNPKAYYEYEIVEKFECGIVLVGSEVKSCRARKVSIKEAHGRVENNEVWLRGMDIRPYENAGYTPHDPKAKRKLLLHKREIKKIRVKVDERGYTIVPLAMYLKGRHIKVEIALGRGKKLYDKRHTLKDRDAKRELNRIMKQKF